MILIGGQTGQIIINKKNRHRRQKKKPLGVTSNRQQPIPLNNQHFVKKKIKGFVEADRNIGFVSTNSLQSKLKITMNLILGAMNNILHIDKLFQTDSVIPVNR